MKIVKRNYLGKNISKTKVKKSYSALGKAMLKSEASAYSSELSQYEKLEFKSIKEVLKEKSAHNTKYKQ